MAHYVYSVAFINPATAGTRNGTLLGGAGMQGSTDQGFILARGDFSSARSLHDQEDRLPLEEFRTARVVGDFSSSLPG